VERLLVDFNNRKVFNQLTRDVILKKVKLQEGSEALIHQQNIICGVAFDRSSLRRIAPYGSVVAPRRLASNTLLVIRNTP
jgi:hypothetical protein